VSAKKTGSSGGGASPPASSKVIGSRLRCELEKARWRRRRRELEEARRRGAPPPGHLLRLRRAPPRREPEGREKGICVAATLIDPVAVSREGGHTQIEVHRRKRRSLPLDSMNLRRATWRWSRRHGGGGGAGRRWCKRRG
jgi:hypothetical protein